MIRRMLGRLRRGAKRLIARPEAPFVPDASYFTDPRKVYLASADQWRGLEGLCEAPSIWSCREFHAVIGGLGCLNLLSRLDDPVKVRLFDINPHQVAYGDMVLAVVSASSSRQEFISLLLQRPFDPMDVVDERLAAFYAQPRDPTLRQRLIDILGRERHGLHERYLGPHLDHLGAAISGTMTDHCLELSLVHDAPADAPMTIPGVSVHDQLAGGRISRNSFFFGRGWLRNERRFQRVRSALAGDVALAVGDIAALKPGDEAGLYASNILEGDSPLVPELLRRFDWMAWYTPASRYLHAAYASSGRVLLSSAGSLSDEAGPHRTCERILQRELQLDRERFVEVVLPNPLEGMHTGFRFLPRQEKVTVAAFLDADFAPFPGTSCAGLHTLLGCGLPWDSFQAVVEHACRSFRSVFVLEHHPLAPDWPEPDVHAHQLPPPVLIERLLLRLRPDWKRFEQRSRAGDVHPRNLVWVSTGP